MVFAQTRRYDSAAAAMQLLIDVLSKKDKKELVYLYDSKEMAYYALGLSYAQIGRIPEAREAQGHALEENLAFAPAHVALGQLAVAVRDTATARAEYALAVELEPNDGAIRYWYGSALLRAQAPEEAVKQLKESIRLEPYFADPWFTLGLAYATQHDTASAVAAYSEFLNRAPRRSTGIALAQQRIAALKH
jgi:predicted Zn-dependent protease